MRFEPRLYHEDGEENLLAKGDAPASGFGDHSDLPGEFAELAEQLSDDADSLARCYPPRRLSNCGAVRDGVNRRNRRWLRWSGAAAAVLLAVGTWKVVDDRASRDDSPPVHTISSVAASSRGAPSDRPVAVDEHSLAAAKPTTIESELAPSIFRGLTGAEQEAVLDLIQDSAPHSGQLTI